MFALQKQAAHFVTVDNLDLAIEAALNTRRIDNFAIDVDGNRYVEQADGSTVIRPNTEHQELADNGA